MSLVGFIILLIIAAVAGSVGQLIGGFSRGGCLVSIVFGFIGSLIGLWLARQFGLPEFIPITVEGQTFPVVWAIVGSAIVSLVLGLLTRRGRRL